MKISAVGMGLSFLSICALFEGCAFKGNEKSAGEPAVPGTDTSYLSPTEPPVIGPIPEGMKFESVFVLDLLDDTLANFKVIRDQSGEMGLFYAVRIKNNVGGAVTITIPTKLTASVDEEYKTYSINTNTDLPNLECSSEQIATAGSNPLGTNVYILPVTDNLHSSWRRWADQNQTQNVTIKNTEELILGFYASDPAIVNIVRLGRKYSTASDVEAPVKCHAGCKTGFIEPFRQPSPLCDLTPNINPWCKTLCQRSYDNCGGCKNYPTENCDNCYRYSTVYLFWWANNMCPGMDEPALHRCGPDNAELLDRWSIIYENQTLKTGTQSGYITLSIDQSQSINVVGENGETAVLGFVDKKIIVSN